MILFLTSSPSGDLDGKYICEGFDNRNGFADEIKKVWKDNARVLMISAFPDNYYGNEKMKSFFIDVVEKTKLSCSAFDLWDARVLNAEENYSARKLRNYDVIVLGGGHVPTQNAFFHKLNLRESIKDFEGIVIGISAGTMNSADEVYAQPEEKGEAIDPGYRRFITGLGITQINVLPHYQMVKDNYLDGLHLFNDISIPDSVGRKFIAIPDGSYIVEKTGCPAVIHGKAYLIENGKMNTLCEDGERTTL